MEDCKHLECLKVRFRAAVPRPLLSMPLRQPVLHHETVSLTPLPSEVLLNVQYMLATKHKLKETGHSGVGKNFQRSVGFRCVAGCAEPDAEG